MSLRARFRTLLETAARARNDRPSARDRWLCPGNEWATEGAEPCRRLRIAAVSWIWRLCRRFGRPHDTAAPSRTDGKEGVAGSSPAEGFSECGPYSWRLAAAAVRPGTGLGLALVAQQAREHAATVHVDPSPAGGVRVVVGFGVA